jgi:hypothetical protein
MVWWLDEQRYVTFFFLLEFVDGGEKEGVMRSSDTSEPARATNMARVNVADLFPGIHVVV